MNSQPYRFAAARPDHYATVWRRLRTRRLVRRLAFGLLVCALIAAVAVAVTTTEFPAHAIVFPVWEYVGLALGVAFLALTAVFARHFVPFLCPRCEQPFFLGLFAEIGFTKNCANCYLELGTQAPMSSETDAS